MGKMPELVRVNYYSVLGAVAQMVGKVEKVAMEWLELVVVVRLVVV